MKRLISFLGKDASVLLSSPPFNEWRFDRTQEDCLPDPGIGYEFKTSGLALGCDGQNIVNSIFIFSKEFKGFNMDFLDISFELNRYQVRKIFGEPDASGEAFAHEILGEIGSWDRFREGDVAIHFEYESDDSKINKITLMTKNKIPA